MCVPVLGQKLRYCEYPEVTKSSFRKCSPSIRENSPDGLSRETFLSSGMPRDHHGKEQMAVPWIAVPHRYFAHMFRGCQIEAEDVQGRKHSFEDAKIAAYGLEFMRSAGAFHVRDA